MASSESIQMASRDLLDSKGCPSPEALLIRASSRAAIAGFECAGHDAAGASPVDEQGKEPHTCSEASNIVGGRKKDVVISIPAAHAEMQDSPYSVSFSVPASPSGLHLAQLGKSTRSDGDVACVGAAPRETKLDIHPVEPQLLKQARYHSQPSLTIRGGEEPPLHRTVPRSDSTRDRRFDHFRTFSGRLERQLSNLRGLPQESDDIEPAESKISEEDTDDEVPTADRYFAALEGPELETLRATEVPVLPKDETWPFLLRFPISAFGMCLGVSSQAMLWKTLASEPSTAFLGVSPDVNHVLWWVSVALMGFVSVIYLLKIVFYFEAVRREFYHPIRVNFFFAPWIACLFLVKGLPRPVWEIHHVVWYLLMAPILCLELKIYGQWMSGGERRLSKVANPSNHLAVVGNFVGALLGARMGLRELPIFFFAVGLAHYLVLFVTLYQRLPTNVQLPKELHPVFFLFIAAPSVASMAWARICGEFNYGAKIVYFIAIFLYISLVVRVNFFRGCRFSLAWWAYTFPMTSAAIATVLYASAVTNALTRALAIGLSGLAAVTVTGVLVMTIYHAFVRKDLFPNDMSIAITQRKPKFSKVLAHFRSSSSDVQELVLSTSKHGSDSDSASVCKTSNAAGSPQWRTGMAGRSLRLDLGQRAALSKVIQPKKSLSSASIT